MIKTKRFGSAPAIIATGIFAALLAMAITFWVRSHSRGDTVLRYVDPAYFDAMSVDGLIAISWGTLHSDKYPPPTGWSVSFWPFTRDYHTFSADIPNMFRHYWKGFGFAHFVHQSDGSSHDARAFVIPYWFICLTLAMFLAMSVRRLHHHVRQHRRIAAGLCIGCGYDLRASKDRCPECGSTKLHAL